MAPARMLVLAVDGLDPTDEDALRADGGAHPGLAELLGPAATVLAVHPDGSSEPAPTLSRLLTGAGDARTGVPTQLPFAPTPGAPPAWTPADLRVPTLLDTARAAGRSTVVIGWPVLMGGAAHRRDHLAAREAADVLRDDRPDLTLLHLQGLGRARRSRDLPDPPLDGTAAALEAVLTAFGRGEEDLVLLVPGTPLVRTRLLVHPNTLLAGLGLLRPAGGGITEVTAAVWPDGPRGLLHVRRDAGPGAGARALAALGTLTTHPALTLREVGDGSGATPTTDVTAVLEGAPGTVLGLCATARPLVDGTDPYAAGPARVADPGARTLVRALGPMPGGDPGAGGGWADLGRLVASAAGLPSTTPAPRTSATTTPATPAAAVS